MDQKELHSKDLKKFLIVKNSQRIGRLQSLIDNRQPQVCSIFSDLSFIFLIGFMKFFSLKIGEKDKQSPHFKQPGNIFHFPFALKPDFYESIKS